MTTIVFLHIPKTAGQTVHAELERVIGCTQTSPVRVHSKAGTDGQFPTGYRLYSGHLDWTRLNTLNPDRFVFTVLRDPRERIASFYFYMLEKAKALDEATLAAPNLVGMRMIRNHSADDYFFGGSPGWKRFIRDHYDNFYCTYFATQKMRGWTEISKLRKTDLVALALAGAERIDAIYSLDALPQLEKDLHPLIGAPVHLAGNRINAGPQPEGAKRWPKLLERLERDDSATRLERFAAFDSRLMQQINWR